MPYSLATDRPVFWAVTKGGNALEAGMQPINSVVFTGDDKAITSDTSENAFLGGMAGKVGNFRPLPDTGRLEAGDIYGYKDGLLLVRQSHDRTIYPPEDTLNLFTVYRAGGPDVLEWVAGEKVETGARRTYGGKIYAAVTGHYTQDDYTPDKTPALWKEVTTGGGIGEWKQPTGAHDSYKKGDRVTWKGSTWESTLDANVWEPGVYGWQKV